MKFIETTYKLHIPYVVSMKFHKNYIMKFQCNYIGTTYITFTLQHIYVKHVVLTCHLTCVVFIHPRRKKNGVNGTC